MHPVCNPSIWSATLITRAATLPTPGFVDDDDFFANIPQDQMVAALRPPPHVPPPHVPPPHAPPTHAPPTHAPPTHAPPQNAGIAEIEAELAAARVAALEAKLAAAKAAQSAPQPPHPPNPPYAPNAPNPAYPPSAPQPGVPAGEPSVRAARKLSTKRPLTGGEGADARATKQHTVDLT